MEISIREAAPLLGRSERAVRAKILRGELPARRQGRTWRIPLATLPLTAEQRDSLQQRGDAARQALDAVLPSRLPHDRRHSSRSVADLLPFARSNALLRQLAQVDPQCHDARRAQRWLRRAMLLLSAAAVEFAPTHRISALRRARFGLGHVVGLLLSSGSVPVAAVQASVSLLENARERLWRHLHGVGDARRGGAALFVGVDDGAPDVRLILADEATRSAADGHRRCPPQPLPRSRSLSGQFGRPSARPTAICGRRWPPPWPILRSRVTALWSLPGVPRPPRRRQGGESVRNRSCSAERVALPG